MELYFHSICNLTEARFAASVYPKFLGFNFSVHSSNYISPLDYSIINPWLAGAESVAQFSYEPIQSILPIVEKLEIKWIEIPSDHPDFDELKKNYGIISTSGLHQNAEFNRGELLQNNTHCNISTFYEIDPKDPNSANLIKSKQPDLIAISGGSIETEPGMADLSDWADLMEELEIL